MNSEPQEDIMKKVPNIKVIRAFSKIHGAEICPQKYTKRQIRRLAKIKCVVSKFVSELDEAHRNARKSKLIFRTPRSVA